MELKVGQHWNDGYPYSRWASIRIDEVEGDIVSFTVFGTDGNEYGKHEDSSRGVKNLMEKYNYTLSKSHNFSNLYDKLCSTN